MYKDEGIQDFYYLVSDRETLKENPYSNYTNKVPFSITGNKFNILMQKKEGTKLFIEDKNATRIEEVTWQTYKVKADDDILKEYLKGLLQKYIYDKTDGSPNALTECMKIKEYIEKFELNLPAPFFSQRVSYVDKYFEEHKIIEETDLVNLINNIMSENFEDIIQNQ